jgi:O-antigen/teichoic acid export membrane protein
MSRLLRNIAFNVGGQGLVLVLGFIGVKFIYGRLGADAFGIIYFSLLMTGVLTSALELGVLSTTIREVSSHHATDRDYVNRLIRTASLFYWGLGVALFLMVLVGAPFLVAHWVNLKSVAPQLAIDMLRILSISSLITLPRALYASLFQGLQLMGRNNVIDVVSSAFQQLGTIALLAAGADAIQVSVWIAAAAVLSTLAYLVLAGRSFGWRTLVPGYFADVVQRNRRFTAHMGALSVLNIVLIQFDKVAVSKLLPVASVGLYSFASTVVVRVSFAAGAINQAALPAFASAHRSGDLGSLRAQYGRLQDLVCLGMLPLFAVVAFGAVPLYTYLFSHETALLLLIPTMLLCLGFYMSATVSIPYTLSVAVGRPEIAYRSNLRALFIVLPAATLLTYFYGLPGAAATWVIYYLFLYVAMIPNIMRECLRAAAAVWYAHLGRILLLAVLCYGLAWAVAAAPSNYSTLQLATGYLVATAAFAAGGLVLIGPESRAAVWRLPRRLVGAPGG